LYRFHERFQTLGLYEKGSPRHKELQASLHNLLTSRGSMVPIAELASGEVSRVGSFPVAGSSSFDIWEGLWLDKEKVALKVLRGVNMGPSTRRVRLLTVTDGEKPLTFHFQRFHREAAIWRQVWSKDLGQSILPFYGICSDDGPYPCVALMTCLSLAHVWHCSYMVSPWMENGHANEYLALHPEADPMAFVSPLLL
jgi:hypothetical protein